MRDRLRLSLRRVRRRVPRPSLSIVKRYTRYPIPKPRVYSLPQHTSRAPLVEILSVRGHFSPFGGALLPKFAIRRLGQSWVGANAERASDKATGSRDSHWEHVVGTGRRVVGRSTCIGGVGAGFNVKGE
jgi:hypothetical protein